jgi:hypothetical protein
MRLWLLLVLAGVGLGYLVDAQNYFYLNASYARQTISFTMCFRVAAPTTVRLQSDILVPQQDHVTLAELDPEKGFIFDKPFDPDSVGFNNFDLG